MPGTRMSPSQAEALAPQRRVSPSGQEIKLWAVIGGDEDEGIFQQAGILQRFDDFANVGIYLNYEIF